MKHLVSWDKNHIDVVYSVQFEDFELATSGWRHREYFVREPRNGRDEVILDIPTYYDHYVIFSSASKFSQEYRRCVGHTPEGVEIYGYYPGCGVDHKKYKNEPVILVAGDVVVVCGKNDTNMFLKKLYMGAQLPTWHKEEKHIIYYIYNNNEYIEKEKVITCILPPEFSYLDPLQWVDFTDISDSEGEIRLIEGVRIKHYCKNKFIHINKYGYIDKIWSSNPFEKTGELMDGWCFLYGSGIAFRRKDVSTIETKKINFIEIRENYRYFEVSGTIDVDIVSWNEMAKGSSFDRLKFEAFQRINIY